MIIFSNHLDFILEHISNPEINARALVEFSLFDHQLHTKTIIKNIFLIPGGYYVTLDRRHTPQFTLAYDIAKWLKRNLRPRKESLEAIDDILHKVLRNYSDSVPSFNLSLTGGFDGRLNLALLDTHDYRKMYAFSYGKKGSNQISIPSKIASKLHFMYRPISLDNEFLNSYAEMGYLSILLTSGTTAFNRAVYPYAYKKISEFSKSCILGQCDFIRPLYNNPAGVIFNVFSQAAVLDENYDNFIMEYNKLRERAFINQDYFTKTVADDIYSEIYKLYTEPYKDLSNKERFFFFLYKESIMKYWHTECHLVNLFVDDFITFSDLDYLEELFQSEYCGLYKGLLVKSQLQRRNAHDLYIDLYEINNKKLNFYYNDRYFKPQWLKYGLPGFALAGIGKRIAKFRQKIYGNDTFGGAEWTSLFYLKYQTQIAHNNRFFELNHILNTLAYTDDNDYRKDRHSSLKLWFDIHGLE